MLNRMNIYKTVLECKTSTRILKVNVELIELISEQIVNSVILFLRVEPEEKVITCYVF